MALPSWWQVATPQAYLTYDLRNLLVRNRKCDQT